MVGMSHIKADVKTSVQKSIYDGYTHDIKYWLLQYEYDIVLYV